MEHNCRKSSGLLASELLLEREINFYFVEGTVILDPVTNIIPTDRLLSHSPTSSSLANVVGTDLGLVRFSQC